MKSSRFTPTMKGAERIFSYTPFRDGIMVLENPNFCSFTQRVVYIHEIKEKAEIFWQTVNANHLLENYNDKISQWGKDHDLKFNDFKNLLSGNTVMSRTKGDNFIAVAYDNSKKNYYFIKFALSKRFQQTFIIIITAYATKNSNHIKAYKDYEAETRRKFAP